MEPITETTVPSTPRRPVAPTRRRHAARRSRMAAATLSVLTTGVLTASFAHADRAEAATTTSTATSFTGSTVTNKWGPTQVRITVASGKITNVTAVQLPSSKAKSTRLSSGAASTLKTKVLAAQSADVSTVSGATMTSESYLSSLQNAIDQARAAGALS